MHHGPDQGLRALFEFLNDNADHAHVLATVIGTEGSTYRKPGAMVLLTSGGKAVGLVSGGCLESDLCERARPVLETGLAKRVEYDLRDDDPLWGLGLGCKGRLELLLEPAHPDNGFAGLADIRPHWRAHRRVDLLKTIQPGGDAALGGRWLLGENEALPFAAAREQALPGGSTWLWSGEARFIRIPVFPPPGMLICGAGPDAVPLAEAAAAIGWEVSVYDHRPAYAQADHFRCAERIVCAPAGALSEQPWLRNIEAAVVMSHHLESDIAYTRALAGTDIAYVGLLGPAARRAELLDAASVAGSARFFGPAGFDIGSDAPETIALSIIAEAHAVLRGRGGGSLRELG